MRLNPLDYWTVFVLRKLRPYMTVGSILRYRTVLGRVRKGKTRPDSPLLLHMKVPTRHTICLREGWPDFDSFGEIFIRDVYGIVVDHITDCRTIIDLGGNIGLAALYFAIKYPQSRIVSVEPLPQNFQLLWRNLEGLISSRRCMPLQAAVWSSAKNLVADPSKPAERYNAFAVREPAAGTSADGPVSGLTMATIIGQSGFGAIDLVKIDIEGAETELFRGDLDWLTQTRAVAIEFHGDSRRGCGFDGIMERFGFKVVNDNDHTVLATK